MTKRRKKRPLLHGGFTLVEALVATVILGGAVVTISAISTRCLNQARQNLENEQAWQALDRQLKMIDMTGIETFVLQGVMEGSVEGTENAEGEPRFFWKAVTQSEQIDQLYQLRLTVWWYSDRKVRSVSATTYLNGAGLPMF